MYLLIFNFLRFISVPSKSEAYTKVCNLYLREKIELKNGTIAHVQDLWPAYSFRWLLFILREERYRSAKEKEYVAT